MDRIFGKVLTATNTCVLGKYLRILAVIKLFASNPRVDDEVLQKYRREIKKHFSRTEKQELRDDPSRIWNLIEKAIVSRPEKERSSVITTPAGCIRTCTGSFLSKKILFVAIARTLGVAARLNPHDRSMEYMEKTKKD